ncbi:MAG: hypothetical protein II956_08465 [Bacteroidales bacterium]|nr:hypothetical protein [Bacteroidales bacterium]
MATVNVYQRYFEAEMLFNGLKRKGVNVLLVSCSENGNIKYTAEIAFFPHSDSEDFAVSYDAHFIKTLFEGKGRRSKKKEKEFLAQLFSVAENLAEENGGKIFFDKPLSEERTA